MSGVTRPEAFSISEIKSKAMDKINMGGSFLQQSQSVTVGGLPVAIRKGGLGGGLGGALGGLVSQVTQAGDIASLVQNPMAISQTLVGNSISGVNSKFSSITGQFTGGQLSGLSATISNLESSLTNFEAHTSNLSGLSSSIDETIPDFKKITNVGENLRGFGTDSVEGFTSNTASALTSQTTLNDVKDTLDVIVLSKLNRIESLNANSVSGQTEISLIVTELNNLLNTQTNTINEIVTFDTNNYNEASNTLAASQDVIGLAEQFNDQDSVSYALLVNAGIAKRSTISSFESAIQQSEE